MYGVPTGQTALVADGLGLAWADVRADAAVLTVANLAPVVRVHFPRKGPIAGFAGAGVGWARFRGSYTGVGAREDFTLSFTGLDVPMHAGAMYYVNRWVAVGGMVEYRWTHWALLRVDHPRNNLVAPLRVVKSTAESNGLEFSPQLPHMWMVSVGVRLTI
jgi:hypothetical protein